MVEISFKTLSTSYTTSMVIHYKHGHTGAGEKKI